MSNVSITMTSTTQGNKKLSRSITNVNPAATDNQIIAFVQGLNALTTNELGTISRVDKREIDTVDVPINPTVTIDLQSDPNNAITVDGTNVTVDNSKLSAELSDSSYGAIIAKKDTQAINVKSFTATADKKSYLYFGIDGGSGNQSNLSFNVSKQENMTTDIHLTVTVNYSNIDGKRVNPVTINFTIITGG